MSRSQLLYAKVARRIHGDRKFRSLKRVARHAWLTLLTSDHQCGLPGFWRASEAMVLDELVDYTADEWHEARAELEAAGMLRFDETERIVWLVNAIRAEYNTPDNPNIARSWARKLVQFERCQILVEYALAMLAESERWSRGVKEAFCITLEESGFDISNLTTVAATVSEPFANGPATKSSCLLLTSPATASSRGRKEKPPAPTTEALAVLARCPRFMLPDPPERSHRGMLADMLKLAAIERWPVLVAWVAAGGGWPQQIDLGRLRTQFSTWMPEATKWDAAGRPAITASNGPRRSTADESTRHDTKIITDEELT